MIIREEDYLAHYGMPRRSGRYPWGSGENPYQRNNKDFLQRYKELKDQGMTESEIANAFGIKTPRLRAIKSMAVNEERRERINQIENLKEHGYSNTEIARRMGLNESTVRSLLAEGRSDRTEIIRETANQIKKAVDENGYIDVGKGTEISAGVSRDRMKTAIAMLEEEGYVKLYYRVEQQGTGHKTSVEIMAPPGTVPKEFYDAVKKDPSIIKPFDMTENSEGEWHKLGLEPPESVSSDRILVRYAEEGGLEKDGVIELRRGVDDISLHNAKYAQVRIAVDGTNYLKGMAMYGQDKDFPPGVDIIVNSNKHVGTPLINPNNKDFQVSKTMKDDPDNPFGASIKLEDKLHMTQRHYIDENGVSRLSALNVVNEEGDWNEWSRTLASQFLSKQPLPLIKRQLSLAYAEKKDEYDDICRLTNGEIKKSLLSDFADECDSAAVHLKAAALPRQASKVILPLSDLPETEIYAPTFNQGEEVILVRYPHAGTFEIPRLRVNNNDPSGRSILGNATDAVGISPKVASQLSGADFDGDTVLVIPTKGINVRSDAPLKQLDGFDPKESYPAYPGMKRMTNAVKQQEMGKVSNLITDMNLQGASMDELARAVKHSMVVIDAEKHNLDYKRSEKENGIAELKKKYQPEGGASTLISRAKSPYYTERASYYKVDPNTGEKIPVISKGFTKEKIAKDGTVVVEEVIPKQRSTKMAEAKDASDLLSSNPNNKELVYRDYANQLKALANAARKEELATPSLKYSPQAAKTYAPQVKSLNDKLMEAESNSPKERQAQLLAASVMSAKLRDNPDMTKEEIKKKRGQALNAARSKVNAHKKNIYVTDDEWEAIQNGAISSTKLRKIIQNSDSDRIKQLATPRKTNEIPNSKINRIKAMENSGYTISEISRALGVSTTTVSKVLNSQ